MRNQRAEVLLLVAMLLRLKQSHGYGVSRVVVCLIVAAGTILTVCSGQWKQVTIADLDNPSYGAIATGSPTEVLVVGSEGGRQFVIRSDDGGESFHRTYAGPILSGASGALKSIAYGEGGIVLSVGGFSSIYSVDSGRSWSEMSKLLSDSIVSRVKNYLWHSVVVGADSIVVVSGQDIQGQPVLLRGSLMTEMWEVRNALTYFSRMQYLGGDILKATEDGGRYVYESGDHGTTWTETWRNDNFIHDMWFIDSLSGWVAALDGAWRTRDGGLNWIKAPESRCSSLCFVDSSNGWMLDDSFLGHSVDGGLTYRDQAQNVEGGYGGGRIVAAASPLVAYYSDGRRLFRTSNGGGQATSVIESDIGVDAPTGSMRISPNPAQDWCDVSIRDRIGTEVLLLDVSGRILSTEGMIDHDTYRLATKELANGVYHVVVRTIGAVLSSPLVIVR